MIEFVNLPLSVISLSQFWSSFLPSEVKVVLTSIKNKEYDTHYDNLMLIYID